MIKILTLLICFENYVCISQGVYLERQASREKKKGLHSIACQLSS